MQIKRMQVQIFSVFYFFFILNLKDVGSNPENSKSITNLSTQIRYIPTHLPSQGSAQLPHHGKKSSTTIRRGFVTNSKDAKTQAETK